MAGPKKLTPKQRAQETVHPTTQRKRVAASRANLPPSPRLETKGETGGAQKTSGSRTQASSPMRGKGGGPRPVALRSKQRGAEGEGSIASKGKTRRTGTAEPESGDAQSKARFKPRTGLTPRQGAGARPLQMKSPQRGSEDEQRGTGKRKPVQRKGYSTSSKDDWKPYKRSTSRRKK